MSVTSDNSDSSETVEVDHEEADNEEVDHEEVFFKSFKTLFEQHELSDVTFIVEETPFPAHKLILAAQSEYFRAMLFGGLKESSQKEIVLKDAKKKSFKILLEYFYTARMALTGVEIDLLLDVLELSQKWNIRGLPNEICRFLKRNLDVSYLWNVYKIAETYGYKKLSQKCIDFADCNAVQVVQHKSFLHLASTLMKELISHDNFFAPEEMIFERLCIWISTLEAPLDSEVQQVLEKIRWRYIELPDYARITQHLEVKWDRAAKGIILKKPTQPLQRRSYGLPGVNVADAKRGAKVVEPNGADQHAVNESDEDGYTSHRISPNGDEAIVIELDREYLLSFVKMQLCTDEENFTEYSYYIEVSDDQISWEKIVDYREFHCFDWQQIHFDPRIIRYIKIVGTGASFGEVELEFKILALQAYYFRTSPTYFDKNTGFFVSKNSVLLLPWFRSCDFDTRDCPHAGNHDGHWRDEDDFMCLFPQPIKTSSMRILLFDPAQKGGNYKVQVSKDEKEWKEIGIIIPSASWQVLKFALTPLTYVRVIRPENVEVVPLCINLKHFPKTSNTATKK